MANYNKVLLMGNLTRDPQLKYLPSQMAVAEFGVAINRKFKAQSGEDREEVTFVDCSAFGRTGEVINQYFQKGKAIFIEGRLKYDQWEDKQGGGKRSKMSVVVERFEFVGGKDGGGGGGGGYDTGGSAGEEAPPSPRPATNRPPQASRPPAGRAPVQQQPAEPPFDAEQHIKEDDIPF